MIDPIEFDPVDAIGAGAFGQPGARTFVIQARKGAAMLSVLVEKEQVALLANEAEQFLDRIADEHPEEPGTFGELAGSGAVEEDEPLFRARLIKIALAMVEEKVIFFHYITATGDRPVVFYLHGLEHS